MPEQNPTGGSKEFFYLDEAGQKRDADLHGPILRAVDFPIDEKMMAPIRAKHRAKAKTIGGVPSQRGYPEFDPNQPRDESGRFGSGGGGSESAGGKAPGKAPSKPSSSKASAKAVRGLPDDFEIKDKALKQALERDAFEISAKPSTHFGKDSYDLMVLAKEVPGVERYVKRPARGKEGQYDPRLAELETHSKGEEYLEFTVAKLKPGLSDKITPLSAPDIVYRGMSAEEYQSVQKTGEVRSSGAYNIGEAQEGLTYWTTDPEAAVGYASGFAPWAYKPTFEKPAYVVAVKRPQDVRPVAGVGEHEVGVVGAVDKEEIVGTWVGEVYAFNAGEMNLRADGSIGSSTAPSAQLAWKQVGTAATEHEELPASNLLKPENKTADEVIESVSGGRDYVAFAESKLRNAVPTDAPVADGGFMVKKGSGGEPNEWTPERAQAHDKILNDIFTAEVIAKATPKEGERPVLNVLGGRGGSGKSWFTQSANAPIDINTTFVLNNDDIKDALPGYEGWNAALLHEESSEIGSRAEAIALEAGLNITLDGTMKSEGSLHRRIDTFKAAGYEIRGFYMYTSPANSAQRALGRAVNGQKRNGKGRYVPPAYSLGSLTNETSFDSAKPKMDHWEIYDNNGKAPVFYARKGG